MPIPPQFRAPCAFCGHDVDSRDPGVYQFTSGWVMNRTGGGGHSVSLPERQNRWACRHCVEAAVKGHLHQRQMFG